MKLKFLSDNTATAFLLRNTKKLINKLASAIEKVALNKKKHVPRSKPNPKTVPLPPRDSSKEILVQPFQLASKINALSVAAQSKFLIENCFISCENGKILKPLMVKLTLNQDSLLNTYKKLKQIDSSASDNTFLVPLLSLIPVQSIHFNQNLLKEFQANSNEYALQKPIPGKSNLINVSVSNATNDSPYPDVKIITGTIPLPVGVLRMMDLCLKSVQPAA